MAGDGLSDVLINLSRVERDWQSAASRAGEEIAVLLENYAKAYHGDTPRSAGYVFPGGGVKRWRAAGAGWGDVTGLTQQATRGFVERETRNFVLVALTAGTDYAKFLELARQGRWSWLWPAVTAKKQQIIDIFAKHLSIG